MKILVIGGAGYIGSHVTLEFLNKGHEVCVFDNLSTGKKVNLFPNAQFIEGDILDEKKLDEVFAMGWDGLVHLAAFKAAGESMIEPEKYSVNNITGTLNILNAASKHGCKRFIFSSSAATYGEPEYLPIDENHPTNPENYYGFTKLEIERFLAWYDKLKGIKFAALRYFNAAGYVPENRVKGLEEGCANLLPFIMDVAAGLRPELKIFGDDFDTKDGTGVRDYVHVLDLARAHVMAFEHINKTDESLTVNLGSESGITVKEILEAARRITGKDIPATVTGRRAGDPAKLVASSTYARNELKWSAQYSDVDTLVKSTWEAYVNAGVVKS